MILDGKKISAEILERLRKDIAALSFRPKLIDVLVGDDPVTESYIRIKTKRAAEIGIDFEVKHFPKDVTQKELETGVITLNSTPNLCGLIVQLPLPEHIDKQAVLDQIDPQLDVDVVTSINLGKLFTGKQFLSPATAAAVIRILDSKANSLKGKNILVVGAGDLVGKPVAFLLIQMQATVTVANITTNNLKELCQSADIIISATGVPNLIKANMVNAHTIVVDAGTAESAGGIKGDVDFENVKDIVAQISPVPGGVGPVTVAMLLYNVVEVAKQIDKAR